MVEVVDRYPDHAYRTIRLTMEGIPGVVDATPEPKLSYHHRFYFMVPREYPQNLGKIKIVNETPLFHPRIAAVGTKACYTVNGEIDRVLVDLIYNVLLRPETVRPPTMFKDADWGLNSARMRWYIEYGPDRIYRFLKSEWAARQEKRTLTSPGKAKKVQIL